MKNSNFISNVFNNAIDYFYNKNISVFEKIVLGVVLFICICDCISLDAIPLIDEFIELTFFNTFFKKRIDMANKKAIELN